MPKMGILNGFPPVAEAKSPPNKVNKKMSQMGEGGRRERPRNEGEMGEEPFVANPSFSHSFGFFIRQRSQNVHHYKIGIGIGMNRRKNM
jgi:hypothetical protein